MKILRKTLRGFGNILFLVWGLFLCIMLLTAVTVMLHLEGVISVEPVIAVLNYLIDNAIRAVVGWLM